jgi:threonine dehydrogenase-like Zn-dependent dehydrogenase
MGKAVTLRAAGRVELAEVDDPVVGSEEVAGRTLVTLISPGTELAYLASEDLAAQSELHDDGRRFVPGYAAVFRIDELGDDVGGLTTGQLALCMGGHRSRQCHPAKIVIPLPAGLDPADAVFARIAGVSMTTLVTTSARPPGPVLVIGLGLVGNLAAQVFQAAGYDVTAVDPLEARVALARASGVRRAVATIDESELAPPRLVVECSGHENAVLQGCRLVQQGGELVLVGVPWRPRSEASAHELLHAIFHRYVHLRSGWEWELPLHEEPWRGGSILTNHALALRWIDEGRLHVDALADDVRPDQAQHAYEALLRHDGALTRRLRWDVSS